MYFTIALYCANSRSLFPSGQHLAFPLPVLQVWRRGLPRPLPPPPPLLRGAAPAHGDPGGAVHKEGAGGGHTKVGEDIHS